MSAGEALGKSLAPDGVCAEPQGGWEASEEGQALCFTQLRFELSRHTKQMEQVVASLTHTLRPLAAGDHDSGAPRRAVQRAPLRRGPKIRLALRHVRPGELRARLPAPVGPACGLARPTGLWGGRP